MQKTSPTFDYEERLWKKGIVAIGIDEVGRGAFAGPLVAVALCFPAFFSIKTKKKLKAINDSKLLLAKKREMLAKEVRKHAKFAIANVGIDTINKVGIGKATHIAMVNAVATLKHTLHAPSHLLVDGFIVKDKRGKTLSHQTPIIHGDRISYSIAAASIIAKVHRDGLMRELHNACPMYRFDKNKGYGTKFHRDVIQRIGLSHLHRTCFDLTKYITV